jgi:hypothetical protein
MELILIPRPGDRERLLEHYQTLSSAALEELVESYNKNVSIGITGTQAQGLYLLAMHKVFLNKCGRSPISWTDNMVLALGEVVEASNGQWKLASNG